MLALRNVAIASLETCLESVDGYAPVSTRDATRRVLGTRDPTRIFARSRARGRRTISVRLQSPSMSDAERLSKLRHDLSNPLSALLAETQLLLLNEAQIDPDDGHEPPGDRGAGDPDADDAARDLTPVDQ